MPRPNFALSVWPDWRRLVPINSAAEKLNLHPNHLSKLCAARLETERLAYLGTHPNGGQRQWFISSDFDARLLPGPIADGWTEPDLSEFTSRQRDEALQRRVCVEMFNRAKCTGTGAVNDIVKRLIPELKTLFPGLKISRTRLYTWSNLYNRPADTLKLIDTRGQNRGGKSDAAAWNCFKGLYLHENQPSLRRCWLEVKRIAAEKGWIWCEEDACRYQLNGRISPQDQIKVRNPELYRTQMAPYISQDPEAFSAGECWVGDHKNLDLWCKWGTTIIRPWLSAWMDWRTRRIVGYVLSHSPNSTTILAALRHGLKDERNFGGPRCVWIDNGKDYSAWMFHGSTKSQRRVEIKPHLNPVKTYGIFNALQIEAHFAVPYGPNGKARLETWFRNITPFCQTFESYAGMSVDSKPERLAEVLKNPRLIPTFDVVRQRLAEFIAGNNLRTDHAIDDLSEDGLTLSPDEAMRRWCSTRRMRDQQAMDYLLMNWHKPVTVGRNGIAICLAGQTIRYGQYDEALKRFKADKKAARPPVLVAFDPHDLRTIRVHDEQWRYVCTATMNQVGGQHGTDAISIEHVKTNTRNKARYNKAAKTVNDPDFSITKITTTEEQLAYIAASDAKPLPPAASSMLMLPTPLDQEAKHIDSDLRTAVGAESSSPPIRRALPSLPRNLSPASGDAALRPNPFSKLKEQLHEW